VARRRRLEAACACRVASSCGGSIAPAADQGSSIPR
jgi:hypothetical protein